MTHDQNKKTLRHFQCRDYLWEIFEQMSRELECSTDYLVNEAMRQYARSRNYGTRSASSVPRSTAGSEASIPGLTNAKMTPLSEPPRAPASSYPAAAPPSGYGYGGQSGGYGSQQSYGGYGSYPPAAPSGYPGSGGGLPPVRPPSRQSAYPPAPPPSYASNAPTGAPPPLPAGASRPPSFNPPSTAGMPPLFLLFNGQRIPVNKHEFVIGRGSKTADLPIKDGNISRRHCAVVFENGRFVMKDLGSTNGIEFHGQRIDARPIQEGDVFQLCDYELRFTYR